MNTTNNTNRDVPEAPNQEEGKTGTIGSHQKTAAFEDLEKGVLAALETYSNVHRGSGHNSMVSTHLFEQSRDIILEYLGLNNGKYKVIFCTSIRATILKEQLKPGSYQILSSRDIGLSLGVSALAIKKTALPKGSPFQSGGGTTRLISRTWVIWADAPDRFEAGTPAIVNIIVFARVLRLMQKSGNEIFHNVVPEDSAVADILYKDELDEFSGKELLDKLKNTHIGKGMLVPTAEGEKPYINLDNSASTPTFTPIWNVFYQTLRQSAGIQEKIIQEVRSVCEGMLNAPPDKYELIFTSNTTEAINLAAESLVREPGDENETVILNSMLEHSSNDLPWRMAPGFSLIRLSINPGGFIDIDELERILQDYNQKGNYGKKRIRLVALSGASNVLGICNNLAEISRIVKRNGAQLLVDGAQLVAHRKVDMDAAGIDYLAFSAHKIYAPFGSGVLVARKGLLNFSQEELKSIKSSGEENPGGIAALGKAFILLQRIGMELIGEEEQVLTARLLKGLARIPEIKVHGIKDPDSPEFAHKLGVVVFDLKGKMADKVAKELAIQRGIGVRYGCHCAHILIKHILHVGPGLERFQRVMLNVFPKVKLPGVTRVSLGIENSEEDVDTLIRVLGKIARQDKTSSKKSTTTTDTGSTDLSRAEVKQQIESFTETMATRVFD